MGKREEVRLPKFRFVMNTSGTKLLIPDLGPHGVEFEINEKVDLTEEFSVEEINKSHGLYSACKKSKATDADGKKVPWLTEFKTKEEMDAFTYKSPEPIVNIDDEGSIKLAKGYKPGDSFEAAPTVFDDKLAEEDKKDERLEQRALQQAGRLGKKRKTRADHYAEKNKKQESEEESE